MADLPEYDLDAGMTYPDLRAYVRELSHRDDITDNLFNYFLDMAHRRILRDIKDRLAVSQTTLTIGFDPYILPFEWDEILELTTVATNGNTIKLQRVSRDQFWNDRANNSPDIWSYMINGNTIRFAPEATGFDVVLTYRRKQDPPKSNAIQNGYLLNYPSLYVYGILIEVYAWLHNTEERQKALDNYNSEVAIVNEMNAYKEIGEAPQAIGASSWH